MAAPDDFAKWAASFLRQYEIEQGGEAPPPASEPSSAPAPARYPGLSAEASQLLESVDAGGVPAFVTQSLLKIARDNGIDVARDTTPNDIVAALRRLAEASRG
ncbi:MAG: hypothetical protein ACM3Y9_01220 [Ignavibacteria bacterium]